MIPIAATVRHYRELSGLSITALAKRAGLSKSYIWTLENPTTATPRPSASKLRVLAEALGVSLTDLAGEDHEMIDLQRITFVLPRGLRARTESHGATLSIYIEVAS